MNQSGSYYRLIETNHQWGWGREKTRTDGSFTLYDEIDIINDGEGVGSSVGT